MGDAEVGVVRQLSQVGVGRGIQGFRVLWLFLTDSHVINPQLSGHPLLSRDLRAGCPGAQRARREGFGRGRGERRRVLIRAVARGLFLECLPRSEGVGVKLSRAGGLGGQETLSSSRVSA